MNTMTETNELSLEQLRALYSLAQALNSSRGFDDVINAFLARLSDIVPYDSCGVILADRNGRDFEITHGAGEHGASLVGRRIWPGEGISGWVVANRYPFCNTDPKLDLPNALYEKFANYKTLAIFPILRENDLFGAVTLYSSSLPKYDAAHQRLLSEAISLLGLALSGILAGSRVSAPEEVEAYGSLVTNSSRLSHQYLTQVIQAREVVN